MKINKFLKIVKKDPLLTTIVGGVIVSLISIFIQSKLNLSKTLDSIIFILNYKIPVWIVAIMLVIATAIIKNLKNKQISNSENPKDTTSSNIEIAIDSEDFKENLTLDKKVLSYTKDTFEGITFKWEYKICSTGYIIDNIRPICEKCERNSTIDFNYDIEEKKEIYTIFCTNCCYCKDEDGDPYFDYSLQKVFDESTYDEIIKSIKPRIKAHLAVLKST